MSLVAAPWCISTTANPGALLICYMSEALATTVQLRAEVPMAANTPEPWGPSGTGLYEAAQHAKLRLPPHPILPIKHSPQWHPSCRMFTCQAPC